jgi:hypothetical protein
MTNEAGTRPDRYCSLRQKMSFKSRSGAPQLTVVAGNELGKYCSPCQRIPFNIWQALGRGRGGGRQAKGEGAPAAGRA